MIDYVLGIDSSLTGLGVASIWRHGGIRTARYGRDGHLAETLAERYARVTTLVNEVRPWLLPRTLVVIEGPAYGSSGGSPHDRSHLWWRIVGAALNRELPIAICAPNTRAKYATGNGKAGKKAVRDAVMRRFLVELASFDEADALALAATGAHRLGWIGGTPQQTESLRAIHWPDLSTMEEHCA